MAIDTYQQADKINKKSLGELIRQNAVNGEMGAGASIKRAIGDKLGAQAKKFKEKFDYLNITKMLFGNTAAALLGRAAGRKQEDIEYFANKGVKKNKQVRAKQTDGSLNGNKIGQLDTALYSTVSEGQKPKMRKGDGVTDVLAKLYNLIKNDYTEENKRRKLDKNFSKEKEKSRKKRHKELLKVLTSNTTAAPTATPQNKDGTNSGGGLLSGFGRFFKTVFDYVEKIIEDFKKLIQPLLDFLKLLGEKTLTALTRLALWMISPAGALLLGFLTIAALTAWMASLIARDPQAALRGEGGVGMAVAGLGSEGQFGLYDNAEEEQKRLAAMADPVKRGQVSHEKDVKKLPLPVLEAKRNQMISYGAEGAKTRVEKGQGDKADKITAARFDEIETEIAARKQSASALKIPAMDMDENIEITPPAAVNPSASPVPAEANPVTTRAQSAINENQDMKNQELTGSKSIIVDNSKKISAVGGDSNQGVLLDTSVNVRTDDTTLQKILKQNLRPV